MIRNLRQKSCGVRYIFLGVFQLYVSISYLVSNRSSIVTFNGMDCIHFIRLAFLDHQCMLFLSRAPDHPVSHFLRSERGNWFTRITLLHAEL